MGRGAGSNTQLVVEEAQDLANILKAGKLEAPAKIVHEEIVGPTLGQDAVDGGILSFSDLLCNHIPADAGLLQHSRPCCKYRPDT